MICVAATIKSDDRKSPSIFSKEIALARHLESSWLEMCQVSDVKMEKEDMNSNKREMC